MQTIPLGKTGFEVSRLGVGLSEIRGAGVKKASQVLNAALDAGINLLDTSTCYGDSEDLVGAAVSGRRDEYFLATKAGHSNEHTTGREWTYEIITSSVDASLRRLQTDHLDLVQLHSCGVDVLEEGGVITALQEARDAGKTRFIGYSGDNEAAHWAVDSGLFDTLQTSFNIVEQRARTSGLLGKAADAGMGVIAKRPIANAVWGVARRDGEQGEVTGYGAEYFKRALQMTAEGPIEGEPDDAVKTALGFTFSHPQVSVAIVGTRNERHMASNIQLVEGGVGLPDAVVAALHDRFDRLGDGWGQRT
jgi:aryl-alcohol dehydrogenase-like predicted oxidoreductase